MTKHFSVKQLFLLLGAVITLLMTLIIAATLSLTSSYGELSGALQARYQSYLLADELRQSSDDLTRLARTYVVTGDPRFKQQYFAILAIRDGKKPRPQAPERIYWDYLAASDTPPRPNGEAAALTGLMKQAGFSAAEMAKLEEAKANSDGLVHTETVAMDAVLATQEGKRRADQPTVAEAIAMMHDRAYHDYKVRIMTPVDDFFGLLNQRTLDATHSAAQQANSREYIIYSLLAVSILVLIITLWVAYRLILRRLGAEPAMAEELVKQIASGNLDTQIELQPWDQGSLLANIKLLMENMERLATQADAIGRGDFSQEISLLSQHDRLGHAIRTMNTLLRTAKTDDERRNWLKDGNSRLSTALTGDFSLQQLANTAIGVLGRHLGAGRGVLYLFHAAEASLDLLGSYMYTERANLGSRFQLGQGAVGQVALEKKPIILTTIAADAAPIVTGTSSALPLYTYTYPLLREDCLLGVVELASFERFDELKQEFLSGETEVIASFLYVAQQRENIRELLTIAETAEKEARLHSEHLQQVNLHMEEQQQQLQQQSEELQQTNAQMEEQQQQLQQQSEELQQTNAQMEEQQQQLQQQNQDLRESRHLMDAKARQLEQASQYKSEFLANMSHELRTPLNSIILLSKMMTSNERGASEDETVKWAEIIHRSGEDLLRLINDVLDLSKVEAGRMDLERVKVSSESLRAEFQEVFEHLARDKGLTLVVEDRLQGEFISDRGKLSQILRNLLSNAFKFTKQGGVTFTLSRRANSPLPICLSVRDTGIGIAQEQKALIFEAFQQADGSTSREYGGTGLGLTISLRFAELLGGTIELQSVPGQGSEFSLLLPDTAPATRTAQIPQLPPAATRLAPALGSVPVPAEATDDDRNNLAANDQIILMIDDDPVLGQTLMLINRRLGYKTLLARTGFEGLALAHSHRPQGILLDLGLPDMDGADVLHELKSNRELAATPVYIVSARDRDEAFMRQGASGFLQKPVDEKRLADVEVALLGAVVQASGSPILVVENGNISAADVARIVGPASDSVVGVAPNAVWVEVLQQYGCRLAIIDLGAAAVQQGLDIAAALRAGNPEIALVFYGSTALSDEDNASLHRYSDSMIIKTPQAEQRLLENVERFLHEVPRERAAAQLPLSPASHSKQLAGKHILVTDDDPRNLFVMSAALERHGAKTSNAINGRRALEFLEQQRVDLVIMDIMMPQMDGYQTITAIRQNPALAAIPVLAITAKALPGDRDKVLAAGADDYLSKPVDYAELLAKAVKWSAGRHL
ncbi:MAG: response regulator [Pseudomonas sp.]|uniref:response regulator n=1 Tax=Pseudomonas sp. TaxID=306 RepID=UPI002733C108|nr:response regulator [Pseudomonas sp.]MDP3847447.1 response regulator [Pseudomonas sp.]